MNGKLAIVLRKEYLERVRTKSFVIGTVLGPILIAAMMFGPAFLADRTEAEHMDVAILDLGSGEAAQRIVDSVQSSETAVGEGFPLSVSVHDAAAGLDSARAFLDARVSADEIGGYLVLSEDFLESGQATYYGERLSGVVGVEVLEGVLDRVVQRERMAELGIGAADLATVLKGADLELRAVGSEEEGNLEGRFLMGISMIMLLYFMMIFYGQFTMNAVIEDKSSRVDEVMLARITPTQLMLGKILGQGLVGITQFAVWVGAGVAFSSFGGSISGIDFELGQVGIDLWIWFGVFFVLGYLVYSSLYAGVGALCSSMQDAQQYQGPITMLIVVPMLLLQVLLRNPDSTMSVALSLFPLFTPMLMFIRVVLGKPETWQLVASVAILVLTVWVLMRGAGKLFRLSILKFGRAPNWKEIVALLGSSE